MDILAELQKRLERRGEDIRLTLSLTSINNLFLLLQAGQFEAWSELLTELFNAEVF